MKSLENYANESAFSIDKIFKNESSDSYRKSDKTIDEAITIANKMYPKFGNIVILAGGAGCYPKGTEYFDGSGWKNIEKYDGGKVLQYNLDGTTKLITPIDYINLPIDQFTNIKNRRVDFTTSKDHKHLLLTEKNGNYINKRTHELIETHEKTIRGNRFKLLNSFKYDGRGLDLSDDEIRLRISIIADGHFMNRATMNKCRVSLKKIRKIERLRMLLQKNNITFREYIENDFTRFEFEFINDEKVFDDYWYNASNNQMEVICDEVLKWDGSFIESSNKKSRRSFSSNSKKSIDFIQFAFASIGMDSSLYNDNRGCYSLNISHSKGCTISKNDRSENTTKFTNVESEDGRMYCFTTESGYFPVRQNGKIYVSGNSGKGFVLKNELAIDGKVLDVDALKTLAMKSKMIVKKAKDEYGVDISKMDLKKAENVSTLHEIVGSEMRLDKKQQSALALSVLASPPDRKPNIIFDVTLKDFRKLEKISSMVSKLGYDKKNIHITWVVNDVEVAKEQNKNRSRVVPEDILINTHRGVSMTMGDIVGMGKNIKKYMDGDITLAFNKKGSDSSVVKSQNKDKKGNDNKFISLKPESKIKVKESGKNIDVTKLSKDIKNKIKLYTPNSDFWDTDK